ncbi:MAG TPA: HDOD domain-containing protein [Rhodocyclaceae bacterium]|nr:HDOD domain-containing protein [Rhodocyclaceae bacterium]
MAELIGRFEVRRELGRGAQSVVYLAHDPQLDRDVAVKTLHVGTANRHQNEALLAEARIVSKLRHPGIVPIFDAGQVGGDLYLVFEFVPGENLDSWLKRRGRIAPVEAVALIDRILAAVGAAHAQQVIHRDLKPSNVLMDGDGTPRVMDFGIALRVEHGGSSSAGFSGTPAYMAPEYVRERTVTARNDVFAAGLMLIEMLCGARVFPDEDVQRVMRRIASEDVRWPGEGADIDDRLRSIALRAVARNPAARFQTVEEFRLALQNYLRPPAEDGATEHKAARGTVEFLLRRMRHKSDFPALSESVSAINRITSSESESVNKLSSLVLKDFSLTNKLLRLVNAVHYRHAGGGSISTVSRAVMVLGFDAVRNMAITVLLFEHLENKTNVKQLKEEFLRANLAGTLARELATHQRSRDGEQAFICAIFGNLGRLLAHFYFPEECDEIRSEQARSGCSEAAAAIRVLGIGFDELGTAIAESWGFPALIVDSMRPLPEGRVRKPANREERLRALAGFANDVCAAVALLPPDERDKAMQTIVRRFGEAVPIEDRQLHKLVEQSIDEIGEFSRLIRINLPQTQIGQQLRAFSGGSVMTPGQPDAGEAEGIAATVLEQAPPSAGDTAGGESSGGKPSDAHAVLTAGIQDISNTLVEDYRLNDVLRIILETIYRAMGFKRVLLCVRDARGNCMQGRFGFGPDTAEVARRFRFSLAFTPDIFHAALANGVDILISDIDDPKIAPRVPEWYRKAVDARTFVVLPLTIRKNPVGMIYADNEHAGDIVITDRELSLLRTLRNQAVLAIKQAS